MLIEAAKRNYNKFKVPTCFVESNKIKRKFTNADKADLDIKTSVNKIGEIINFSQELNSRLWDMVNNSNVEEQEIEELYRNISTLSVMSGLAIDSAKQEFKVDIEKELRRLQKLFILKDEQGRKVRPYFFSPLAKYKGYYIKNKIDYRKHDTVMDYLESCINSFRIEKQDLKQFKKLSDMVAANEYQTSKVNYKQCNSLIEDIRDCRTQIIDIWQNGAMDNIEKASLCADIKNRLCERIGKLHFNKDSMRWLISVIDKEDYADISSLLLQGLFGYPNSSFYELLEKSSTRIPSIKMSKDGELKLYNLLYEK